MTKIVYGLAGAVGMFVMAYFVSQWVVGHLLPNEDLVTVTACVAEGFRGECDGPIVVDAITVGAEFTVAGQVCAERAVSMTVTVGWENQATGERVERDDIRVIRARRVRISRDG